ncbi:hypothetical protein ILUMI_22133 [Ignelater luminosus]|uniref:Uncharacterized protein n=1 Tax=Ignelater luminosus TaxID=2038154 RepID=A0A8K0CAP0_IGNLU|nr:hypothetical protein ILUMI_22133 [Ignelater luminosus]
MDYESFSGLLNLVGPLITKRNTVMRKAITAEKRLVATLRYLATGRDYARLRFSTALHVPPFLPTFQGRQHYRPSDLVKQSGGQVARRPDIARQPNGRTKNIHST